MREILILQEMRNVFPIMRYRSIGVEIYCVYNPSNKKWNAYIMSKQSKIEQNLKHLKYQLDREINNLTSLLRTLDVIDSKVYLLPEIKDADTHKDIKKISVSLVSDYKAFNLALQSFSTFEKGLGDSGKRAFRLPGYLVVNGSAIQKENLYENITRINKLKDDFKKQVQGYSKNSNKKYNLVHSLFNNLMTVQVYRHIPLVTENVEYINFSWTNKHITYKTSIQEILNLLDRHRKKTPKRSNSEDWNRIIDNEISIINELPKDTTLRFKRVSKPITRVDVVPYKKNKQIISNIPLILFQTEKPVVSNLQDYLSAQRRSFREDTTIYGIPVIKRLHLYKKHIKRVTNLK
ncbi:hypothetical protein GLP21_12430 [Photobacterium carnosum]|uniref:DNA replication terminus site-binding protein n=2 Tax=Vibrionaceae TaxID=641 RepID=A0A2N4UW76_9GAMM|nr:hypothetical protein [Photobacterium phosphoreum]MCD9538143.1 hypothetical protein [Photobacterium carnosum]MCD9507735.1 hypothetical protein [Photobacterium phosphoreum]MCD9542569.1 hypothetical protein [Photobacterium carnosum]MCD9545955.1 hypothetical protein [Photobacterium carnosum]